MEFVGARLTSATSMSVPTHAAADLLLIGAMNFEGTTIPGTGSGFTSALSGSGSSRAWRLGSRIATASGTASGTWSNASELASLVYRGASGIGAVAASTTGVPELTLQQPGSSWVAVIEVDDPAPAAPTGTVQRDLGSFWRLSDTNGPVSSWPAQTTPARTFSIAYSIEVIPDEPLVGGSYAPSWDVEANVGGSYAPSWDVLELTVGGSYSPSWDVEAFVGGDYGPSWDVEAITGWRALLTSDLWHTRTEGTGTLDVSCRVAVVDYDHQPVTLYDQWGEPLGEVPVTAGEVSMVGESDQVWSCRLTIEDERWVPRTASDPLDPRSPYLLAVYWREKLAEGMWVEIPLGVYRTGEPHMSDKGTVTITVEGKDVLSVAKRGGYGGAVVPVGGLTVDAALTRLFATVAPTVPFSVEPSTVTLPAVYELGRRKPSEDWTEVAGLDQLKIRANREGTLAGAPRPDPQTVTMRLIEGPGCQMSEVQRDLSDTLYNRVTVTGTNPDLTEPVFGYAEDDDETSPTYVGRFGPYELAIDSDAVTTNTGAASLAAMHLGKYRRPTETVTARIRPRPDLEYRDLVEVVRQRSGVVGTYRVSSWRLPLPVRGKAPGEMEVTFMSRQVD